MGFTLPQRMSNNPSAEHVRGLMARKEAIEEEMEAQYSILQSNSVTMDTPLVDSEGFPRADIDIWAVRQARVRIIALRNDHKALMEEIGKALEDVYDPGSFAEREPVAAFIAGPASRTSEPFAKVNGVAPGSPAASAGLLREDLVLSFGPLNKASFPSASLQPLAELVAAQENQELSVEVLRGNDQRARLTFVPRRGWGGPGLLGCHLVPYVAQ